MVVQANAQGSQVIRRLRPDGTTDPTFGLPVYDVVRSIPPVTFPDGSLLIYRPNDPMTPSPPGLLMVTEAGQLDSAWSPPLLQWHDWSGNACSEMKVLLQANGQILVVLTSGCHGSHSTLCRLNLDGSLDASFDASVVSPTPVAGIRLLASGLQGGKTYTLSWGDNLDANSGTWGDVFSFTQRNWPEPM